MSDSRIARFAHMCNRPMGDLHVKTDAGLMPCHKIDLSNHDVVDFYDANGKHLGFLDGAFSQVN